MEKYIVVLDNGHGFNSLGKGSPYALNNVKPEIFIKEYKIARELVKDIYLKLKMAGISAKILVPEDYDVSLSERVKRANGLYNQYKKAFVVSVHLDASGLGNKWMPANGWSIWTSKGITESDKLADYFVKEAVKTFKGKKIRRYMGTPLNQDFEANYTILTKTKCPAVLTENFFQDNIEDAKYITSKEGHDAIVNCHVNAIINYLKDKKWI